MYWPHGVPRVYAINGPGIPYTVSDDEDSIGVENYVEPSLPLSDNAPKQPSGTESAWANEAIDGLCVSRTGHMFATMTHTSIALWQTRVRIGRAGLASRTACVLTMLLLAYRRGRRSDPVYFVARDLRSQCSTSDASRFHHYRCPNPERLPPYLYGCYGSSQPSVSTALRPFYSEAACAPVRGGRCQWGSRRQYAVQDGH